MLEVRSYAPDDYEQIAALYKQSELFGGQFDENRDSEERLRKKIEADPDAILVAQEDSAIVGTVSLIEDGRVAWLFRFCVAEVLHKDEIAHLLNEKVEDILRLRGHHQVLVYTAVQDETLHERYEKLGFTKGGDYTCFWKDF